MLVSRICYNIVWTQPNLWNDQTAHKMESTFKHAHREKTVTSVCCLQFICTLREIIYIYVYVYYTWSGGKERRGRGRCRELRLLADPERAAQCTSPLVRCGRLRRSRRLSASDDAPSRRRGRDSTATVDFAVAVISMIARNSLTVLHWPKVARPVFDPSRRAAQAHLASMFCELLLVPLGEDAANGGEGSGLE